MWTKQIEKQRNKEEEAGWRATRDKAAVNENLYAQPESMPQKVRCAWADADAAAAAAAAVSSNYENNCKQIKYELSIHLAVRSVWPACVSACWHERELKIRPASWPDSDGNVDSVGSVTHLWCS